MFRFIYSFIVICLIPLTPWWFLLLCLAGGIIYFRDYWEGLLISFGYDVLFGLSAGNFLHSPFFQTIILIILFLLVAGYRDTIRLYR